MFIKYRRRRKRNDGGQKISTKRLLQAFGEAAAVSSALSAAYRLRKLACLGK